MGLAAAKRMNLCLCKNSASGGCDCRVNITTCDNWIELVTCRKPTCIDDAIETSFVENIACKCLILIASARTKREGRFAAIAAMSELKFSRQASLDAPFAQLYWFAAIFAIITYIAVSMRATLSPWEVNYFIDTKRLVSVLAGAVIFWLAMRAAQQVADERPRDQIIAILNVSIPGTLLLLLAREAYDLVGSGELAPELSLNLRWILTWVGYFAAGVGAFVAFCYHRRLQFITAQIAAMPIVAPQTAVEQNPPVTNQMIEQVIDALAAEIAVDRNTSLALQQGRQGQDSYEWADTNFDPAVQARKQRQQLIDQLSKRLAAKNQA